MLNQGLKQKQLQKLTPQQIQVIRLLELPVFDFEQKIKKEIEDNPVLEETDSNDSDAEEQESSVDENADEFSLEDYIEDDEIPTYKTRSNNYSDEDKKEDIPFSSGMSFQEFLIDQLRMIQLRDKALKIAVYLIGNIDSDGYLRRGLEDISDDLAFNENLDVSLFELEDVLETVQSLDPVGVAARNLRECLLLQINKKDFTNRNVDLARDILENYFEEFSKKHYDKIIDRIGVSEDRLRAALEEIMKLNPKPGSSYGEDISRNSQVIIPDFILEDNDGKLELSLNAKNVPDLKISRTYVQMLEKKGKNMTSSDKETYDFVKQKVNSAQWFIDAVKQRQITMMDIMETILNIQYIYFQEGDETKLKPMILKDISEKTGYDISTVSRVVSSKHIQTHFGVYPLRYFFSEAMQKEDGEEVSTRQIKSILKDLIEGEDKHKPLTDEKLSELLKQKGYNVARRTVAKYREQMSFPVARMRKSLE